MIPVFFVTFCLWFIVVYSGWILIRGNPSFAHVARTEAGLVARAEALALGETTEASEDELSFLRRFFLLSVLEVTMFLLELATMATLWWVDVMPLLTFALFVKSLLSVAVSLLVAWSSVRGSVFETVLSLPKGLLVFERVNAGLSAVGALVVLLFVNNIAFSD